MRRLSILVACGLGCGAMAQTTSSENLVPNGGFERVVKEPATFDQISRAEGWGSATLGMAEAFGPAAPAKTVGIPLNVYGTQTAYEGERYAGFMAWKDDQRRDYDGGPRDPFKPGWNAYSEYPRTELVEALEEGATYELSFWVALAGNSDRAVAGIGAFLASWKPEYTHRGFMKERPQVVADKILENRGEWTEVKGTFVADGGELYLVLGTFPTAIFDTKRIVEGPDNQYAYYYLDNISLRKTADGDR